MLGGGAVLPVVAKPKIIEDDERKPCAFYSTPRDNQSDV